MGIVLITLYLTVFLTSFGYFLIIPTLFHLINDPAQSILPARLATQWGADLYALILALIPLTGILSSPIYGRLADLLGRKPLLLLGMAINVSSFIVPMLAIHYHSLCLLFISSILNGFASNSQAVAQAVLSDISPYRQGKVYRFSIDFFAMSSATVVGPIAGMLLDKVAIGNWSTLYTPFIAAALLTCIVVVLIIIFIPETLPQQQNKQQSHVNLLQLRQAITDIVNINMRLKLLLLVFFLVEMAWSLYYQNIEWFFQRALHAHTSTITLFFAYLGSWRNVGLLIFLPIVLRRLSLVTLISVCLTAAWLGFLLLLLPGNWIVWLVLAPVCIFIAWLYPTILTLIAENTTIYAQGWILSVASATLGFAWFLSSFLQIELVKISADLPTLIAAMILFCTVVLWFATNKHHSKLSFVQLPKC